MDPNLEHQLQHLRKELKSMLRNAPDVEQAWKMVSAEKEIGEDRLSRTLLQAFVEIYE